MFSPARGARRGPNELTIVVEPCSPGNYAARLDGDDHILCASRCPFLDAARCLIEQGCNPMITLVMRHAGQTVDSLRAPLGVEARLTVDQHSGPVFARWKALPCS